MMTQTAATQRGTQQAPDKNALRPFHVNVPEPELTELRRRILATKWPERETVTDATQGVQLATTQALARYWATDYDWRKIEVKINALPNFVTEIDGLDIHFIHVRSKHENALPLIVTHGWPGSVTEQLKIIDPLTNPTAHGGNASDAFDVERNSRDAKLCAGGCGRQCEQRHDNRRANQPTHTTSRITRGTICPMSVTHDRSFHIARHIA